MLYTVGFDLHSRKAVNILLKYAEDSYLLVASENLQTVASDMDNISQWASANNLWINPQKTRELIIRHNRSKSSSLPDAPFVSGETRVDSPESWSK